MSTSAPAASPRLRSVQIDGLFGRYDYTFDLHLDERVTLLTGENGSGKTTVLRLVDAVFNRRFSEVARTRFDRLVLTFVGGDWIALEKVAAVGQGEDEASLRATWMLGGSGGDEVLRTSLKQQSLVEQAFHERVSSLFGIRDADGAVGGGGTEEAESSGFQQSSPDLLGPLNTYLSTSGAYFIGIHRLLRSPMPARPGLIAKWRGTRGQDQKRDTILVYADAMKERVADNLTSFGLAAQRAEKTLQTRALTPGLQGPDAATLRERLQSLDRLREELRSLGLASDDAPVPVRQESLEKLEPAQRAIVGLMAEDATSRYARLQPLAHRVQLFLKHVNRRFYDLEMKVDSDRGFYVVDREGSLIDLADLSSGEQHEIILTYDLLFNVRPGTLILIDEPEMSNHVAWQEAFLEDLLQIVGVAEIDVLVATHSPFIIKGRWDLVVEFKKP